MVVGSENTLGILRYGTTSTRLPVCTVVILTAVMKEGKTTRAARVLKAKGKDELMYVLELSAQGARWTSITGNMHGLRKRGCRDRHQR